MRIAMLTNNYKPFLGGVPVSVDRLAASLRKRGHTVTVFAPEYDSCEPEQDVYRYKVNKKKLENGMVVPALYDKRVYEHFRGNKYDLIHIHHPMLIGYTGIRIANRQGIPVALTYHTRYEQYIHYILPFADKRDKGKLGGLVVRLASRIVTLHNRIVTNLCDMVIAPTPLIRDFLSENGTKSNIAVLPTGLGSGDFEFDEGEVSRIRREYAGDKRYLFCCVARLEKEKNISFLLEALKLLKDMTGDVFKIMLIGDGSHRETLEKEIVSLGLRDNVTLCGVIPNAELSNYYRASDMFLFSSRSETQGIVLLEAMAAGLPVVAVDASGVCDIVKDGYNGRKTKPDAAEFAAAVAEILQDEAMGRRMSNLAEITADKYTADKIAAAAESLYESLIYEKAHSGQPLRWGARFPGRSSFR
ncbi:MAG: glycosyltransferase [Oscillospiraceae bacterium]|jgi:glycosyltransferase involved in cell wall biosynthesis|nr:glycosyltransferase [Oscillospiraceae bacterium]